MKRFYLIVAVLLAVFIFTGCSRYDVNNISSNPKYKEKLSDVLFIAKSGPIKIRYHKNHNNLDKCKVKYKKLQEFVLSKNTIHEQLKQRDVKLNYVKEGYYPKRLLVLTPVELYSSDFLMCDAEYFSIGISLYDFEDISKDWDSKKTPQKVKDFANISDKNLIYKKLYTARFGNRPSGTEEITNAIIAWNDNMITIDWEKEGINNLYIKILNDLEYLGLIPPKPVSKEKEKITLKYGLWEGTI